MRCERLSPDRRCIALLLVSILAVLSIASISASEADANDESDTWYYDQLSDFSKNLYDASKGITDSDTSVSFEYDMSEFHNGGGEKLFQSYTQAAYLALKAEWMGMCMTQGTMIVGTSGNTVTASYTHTDQYSDHNAAMAGIDSYIDSVVINYESMEEAVRSVHDNVCGWLTYGNGADTDKGCSLYNAVCGDREVVCEGYAKLFKAICDANDIPCVIVMGNAVADGQTFSHMYDYVKMDDGNWYLVDPTWDDQSMTMHVYFLAGSGSDGFYMTVEQDHLPGIGGLATPTLSAVRYKTPSVWATFDEDTGTLTINGSGALTASSIWSAYKAKTKNVVISDGITSIGSRSFYEYPALESVTIGKGVQTIEDRAFTRCVSLKSITIPGNVVSIGDYAFYQCTGLTKIITKSGTESIGYRTFYKCTGLKSVTIAKPVTSIGSKAFYGCSFYDTDGATKLDAVPGDIAGYKFTGTSGKLVLDTKFVVGFEFTKNGLKYRVTSALSKDRQVAVVGHTAGITSLAVPDYVSTTAGKIPVTSIGSKAFYGCTTLTAADLGSVTTIGFKSFAKCTSLASLSTLSDMDKICSYAFYGCKKLTKVVVSGTDYRIDTSAFSACTGLKVVKLLGSGATIGTNAFYKCYKLTTLNLNGVSSIGFKAFPYCNGITSLNIPSSVKTIGAYAFYSCDGLKTLTIQDGVQTIGKSAFSACGSLSSVDFGDTVGSIGSNAFYKHSFYSADGKTKLAANAASLAGHSFSGTAAKLLMTA